MKNEYNNNYVITIGREYGSGGREIGKKIAETLNIAFYDKELITIAAKASGLSPELFDSVDEKSTSKLAYALTPEASFCGIPFGGYFSNDLLFNLQSEAMINLVKQESCVIVGRCADFVLRDNPRCINIFIHSPMQNRIRQVMEREKCSKQEAIEKIQKIDKKRTSYYNYYTRKEWGKSSSYHFSIDSSLFGLSNTADLIKTLVTRKLCI